MDPLQSSLPQSVPLLLVKPPIGLSTPEIFKALDLTRASQADPQQLLQAMLTGGLSQDLCVNDLEQPAFDRCCSDVTASVHLMCRASDVLLCPSICFFNSTAWHDSDAQASLPTNTGLQVACVLQTWQSGWPQKLWHVRILSSAVMHRLPALQELKQRLQAESAFSAVFMSGVLLAACRW